MHLRDSSRQALLGAGAGELLALRDALEGFDDFGQEWFDTFTSHVVTLESAGVTSSGQVLPPHSPHEPFVQSALDQLASLVQRMTA